MRARLREACGGLGWYLGPAVALLIFNVLVILLVLAAEANDGSTRAVRLSDADWAFAATLLGIALILVGTGILRRKIVRTPGLEDFGFGWGIDPEFIERRLWTADPDSVTARHPTAKT